MASSIVKTSLTSLTLGILVAATLSAPAQADHRLGADAVDGSEIRYSHNTQWNDAYTHAVSTWGALGSINIAPDTASTIEDLRFTDFDYGANAWTARYIPQAGADQIVFNTYCMSRYSQTKRRGVAAHELAHALGPAHSSGNSATCPCYPGNLMVDNDPGRGSITTPQSHDRNDYRILWVA